jgi:hypothetical protein
MLNLIPVLFLLLVVAILVVPTYYGARLVGAVQVSWLMTVAALFAGLLLSLIVAVPASLVFAAAMKAEPPGALLALLGLAASAFAYAKVLETSFFGGVTIYLVQTVCAAIFAGVIYLGLTAWMPELIAGGSISGVDDIRTATLRIASDDVCNCGADQDCLSRKYREMRKVAAKYEGAFLLRGEKARVDEYSRRAKLCAMQPAPAEATEAAAPAADPVP